MALLSTLEADLSLGLVMAELSKVTSLSTVVALDWVSSAILCHMVEATAVVADDLLRSLLSIAILGNMTELTAVVALNLTVGWLWALGSDMTNLSTVETLLSVGLLWQWAVLGLVIRRTAVVAQSLGLRTVLSLVASQTTLVTSSWEESHDSMYIHHSTNKKRTSALDNLLLFY